MDVCYDEESSPVEDWNAMEPEEIEERYADALPAVEQFDWLMKGMTIVSTIGVSSQVKCTNFRHKVYQVTVRF